MSDAKEEAPKAEIPEGIVQAFLYFIWGKIWTPYVVGVSLLGIIAFAFWCSLPDRDKSALLSGGFSDVEGEPTKTKEVPVRDSTRSTRISELGVVHEKFSEFSKKLVSDVEANRYQRGHISSKPLREDFLNSARTILNSKDHRELEAATYEYVDMEANRKAPIRKTSVAQVINAKKQVFTILSRTKTEGYKLDD